MIRFATKALLGAVGSVMSACSKRSTKPALHCLLIQANKDGSARLSATDLEISMSRTLPVECNEDTTVLLNAEKLYSILSVNRDNETGEIEMSESNCKIRFGKSQYQLATIDEKEFPVQEPVVSALEMVQIKAVDLSRMIDLTLFAVSKSDAKYTTRGLLFSFKRDQFRIVATDTKRLAVSLQRMGKSVDVELEIIVPPRACQVLQSSLSGLGEEDMVEISMVGTNQAEVAFKFPGGQIQTRLLEGKFPAYQQILSKVNEATKVELGGQELANSLSKAGVTTDDESQKMVWEVKSGVLKLTTQDKLGNQSVCEMGIELAGEEQSIALSADLIVPMLKAVGKEKVMIRIDAPTKPMTISKGNDYTFLVMPLSS